MKVLADFLAYMEEILYLCKWILVRHTFQKLFKIKGYDFIQVQAISDKEDEAFGQDAPRGLLCLESCACLAEEVL